MKEIKTKEEFLNQFKSKRIAILVFNKDSRNLIRFLEGGVAADSDIGIDYLIDFTLPYRDKVREKALKVIDEQKIDEQKIEIISDHESLQNLLDDEKVDMLLCFDRFGSVYMDKEKAISDLEGCSTVLKQDYDNMIAENPKASAEFNFRWRVDVVDYINWYAARLGVDIVSAYWDDIFPYENPNIEDINACMANFVSIRVLDIMDNLGNVEIGLRDAPVRFILGADWGVGKTSFLLNRMKEPERNYGITDDAWFALVSKYWIPATSTFEGKGYIAKIVKEIDDFEKESGNQKDIYIKLGGRLEEYVYGIPTDQRMWLDNLPGFFRNAKFDIILKPDPDDNEEITLADFKAYYKLTDDRVTLHRMDYDGYEKAMT